MSDRPVVVVSDRQSCTRVDTGRWRELAGDVLVASGVTAGELSLLFVDDDEMQRLNLLHMSKDRPTDVLAFPLDGADACDRSSLIGDVVVCPAVAAADLAAAGGEGSCSAGSEVDLEADDSARGGCEGRTVSRSALDDQLALLVVHGVLHLLGHDHVDADEAEAMEALERKLLAEHHRRA